MGHALSVRNSWCSEYERILEEFGIFGDGFVPILDGYTALGVGAQHSLPLGSLIARVNGDRLHLKEKIGDGAGRNWQYVVCDALNGTAYLIRNGTDPCLCKPLMWHLPPGTQVCYPEKDGVYTKESDGMWTPNVDGIRHTASRFKADVTLVSLP